MYLHAETWGHVSLNNAPATPEMEAAEEANEVRMLRCRFLKVRSAVCSYLLHKSQMSTKELICNPGTHEDIASLFQITLQVN